MVSVIRSQNHRQSSKYHKKLSKVLASGVVPTLQELRIDIDEGIDISDAISPRPKVDVASSNIPSGPVAQRTTTDIEEDQKHTCWKDS